MIRHLFTIGFLCLNTALLLLCSPGSGGTDLPNTNTIVGKLTATDGSPSFHTKVVLVPNDFNVVTDSSPLLVLTDTTDEHGVFQFSIKEPGEYTITAVQLENRTRAIISNVQVLGDTLELAAKALSKPGQIRVTIPDAADRSTGYFYIPGTTISAKINKDSSTVTLDSVPADTILSINYNEVGTFHEKVIRFDIPVSSEHTTNIVFPSLNRAKPIYFNTTKSGAAVTTSVTDFPVLVRLSSKNFTFSQAATDGNDIRFSKNNGSPLYFEIEKWDPSNKTAIFWVRIDTLLGACDTQSIMMYWGASAASVSESNGAAVFDTSKGFQGVWHFSEQSGTVFKDATFNKYNGTLRGSSSLMSTQGIIGPAQLFDGNDFIEMTGTAGGPLNFPQHGNYSISAWVNIDSLSGEYQLIASKGDKQYNLQFRGATKNWQFTEYQDTTGWDETVSGAAARTWVHLVGVRAGTRQYLYVNGICADSVIYNHPFIASDTTVAEKKGLRNTSCNFMIGKKVDYAEWFFKGSIDEVRVMSISPSAEWIKLCYMNQKSEDLLVVYRK
jgi:hypothetical protein